MWLTETGTRRLEAAIPVWRRAHAALCEIIDPCEVREIAAAAAGLAGRDDTSFAAGRERDQ